MNDIFRLFAQAISVATGTAYAFLIAALVVIIWLVTGPIFGYSDTWQLVINTGTTIVTFLMVFVLQNTQNRDNQAVQLKLDELLRGVKNARSSFIDIEELSDEELDKLAGEFHKISQRAQKERESRGREGQQGTSQATAKKKTG